MLVNNGLHRIYFFRGDGYGPNRAMALSGDHHSLFGCTFATFVLNTG
jgi:hypothetical protein